MDDLLFLKRWIDEDHGYGLFAARDLPANTRLFEEYPHIAMQHGANQKAGVRVCEKCFRFLGPLEAQVQALLSARGSDVVVNGPLPLLGDEATRGVLPTPVPCPGGSELQFCSGACAAANYAEHHRLFCVSPDEAVDYAVNYDAATTPSPSASSAVPKRRLDAAESRALSARVAPPLEDSLTSLKLGESSTASAAPPPSGSGVTVRDVDISDATAAAAPSAPTSSARGVHGAFGASSSDGSSDGADAGIESLAHLEPLPRFVAHAHASNEIFLLAGKAAAKILCALDGLRDPTAVAAAYSEAMAPYAGPPWWDAVATPDDVTDDAAFRRTLRALLTESWTLLAAVLGKRAPPNCPLFASVEPYATIVGAFERRNCAVQVASPVEEYFLAVDALPEGPRKAAITAVTNPLLDALDESYATPCDGTGLFPLQATLNHSCEPNVTLLKEAGDEERDGRVVARLVRDVAAGEELCNAYVDITLPLRRRRRELREYGFECTCARCTREAAAASQKKASDKKAGKRRLK